MGIFKSALSWLKSLGHFFTNQNPQTLSQEAHAAKIAIATLSPGLVLVLQQAGASEGSTQLAQVEKEVLGDLDQVSSLLDEIQSGQDVSSEVVSVLESVKGHLSGILDAGHIKNDKTRQTVTNVANAVIAEVEVIISEFAPKATV